MPEQIVAKAKKTGSQSITFTYTEPTICFEYAFDTAKLARQAGLANIFVTNGYMTRRALEMIGPYLDAANVDLKSFRDASYRINCQARLKPVLDTIVSMKEMDIWLEVTTMVVPGENDSDEELGQIAEFLAGIDQDIPWHISPSHPDDDFSRRQAVPTRTLRRAREIGMEKGLHYVYLRNVREGAHSYCHHCQGLLIERKQTGTDKLHLKNGHCPSCGERFNGVYRRSEAPASSYAPSGMTNKNEYQVRDGW
jgi:pyruvate formate lyase activating enzyme